MSTSLTKAAPPARGASRHTSYEAYDRGLSIIEGFVI